MFTRFSEMIILCRQNIVCRIFAKKINQRLFRIFDLFYVIDCIFLIDFYSIKSPYEHHDKIYTIMAMRIRKITIIPILNQISI